MISESGQSSNIAEELGRTGASPAPLNQKLWDAMLQSVFIKPARHVCRQVASVVSNSVRPHRRQPTRLPRPWDSPGKNTGVGCHFLLQCVKVKSESAVAQSIPTFSDPMDCSPPGSSIHGTFQARVLEWGTIAFSEACLRCAKFKNHCCFSMQGVPVASSKADDLKSSWTFLFSKVSL